MLLLTRRIGEAVMIGTGSNMSTVRILGVKGNQVKIGIDAPKETPVNRQEVHERIQRGVPFAKSTSPTEVTSGAESEAT